VGNSRRVVAVVVTWEEVSTLPTGEGISKYMYRTHLNNRSRYLTDEVRRIIEQLDRPNWQGWTKLADCVNSTFSETGAIQEVANGTVTWDVPAPHVRVLRLQPGRGIEFIDIHLLDRNDAGTGTFRFRTRPGALLPQPGRAWNGALSKLQKVL
jgi:hypothetical protein